MRLVVYYILHGLSGSFPEGSAGGHTFLSGKGEQRFPYSSGSNNSDGHPAYTGMGTQPPDETQGKCEGIGISAVIPRTNHHDGVRPRRVYGRIQSRMVVADAAADSNLCVNSGYGRKKIQTGSQSGYFSHCTGPSGMSATDMAGASSPRFPKDKLPACFLSFLRAPDAGTLIRPAPFAPALSRGSKTARSFSDNSPRTDQSNAPARPWN